MSCGRRGRNNRCVAFARSSSCGSFPSAFIPCAVRIKVVPKSHQSWFSPEKTNFDAKGMADWCGLVCSRNVGQRLDGGRIAGGRVRAWGRCNLKISLLFLVPRMGARGERAAEGCKVDFLRFCDGWWDGTLIGLPRLDGLRCEGIGMLRRNRQRVRRAVLRGAGGRTLGRCASQWPDCFSRCWLMGWATAARRFCREAWLSGGLAEGR